MRNCKNYLKDTQIMLVQKCREAHKPSDGIKCSNKASVRFTCPKTPKIDKEP